MPTYKARLFKITAQTNLHVGSGSQQYGIIDNLIQRDTLTGYPTIHASSLKGSLREYCLYRGMPDATLTYIFGHDSKNKPEEADGTEGKPGKGNNSPGNFRFFDARLLSIPVRSDQVTYFNLSCPQIIDDLLATAKLFDVSLPDQQSYVTARSGLGRHIAVHGESEVGEAILENPDIKAVEADLPTTIRALLGDHPALITNESKNPNLKALSYPEDLFRVLCDDFHLPVIARNQLNYGISGNLWYEQVLPRQTRFYFALLYPDSAGKQLEALEKLLTEPVQIGANASIGYGQCEITPIPTNPIQTR